MPAMGTMSSGNAVNHAGSSKAEAATPPPPPKEAEKTEFKVILEKYDPAAKAKIIREIKNIIPGLNLVEVIKFSSVSRIFL
jgi:ribosomal protein L7/L12